MLKQFKNVKEVSYFIYLFNLSNITEKKIILLA